MNTMSVMVKRPHIWRYLTTQVVKFFRMSDARRTSDRPFRRSRRSEPCGPFPGYSFTNSYLVGGHRPVCGPKVTNLLRFDGFRRRNRCIGLQPAGHRWRLLELLPVDEPVDNFLGWQMAERRLIWEGFSPGLFPFWVSGKKLAFF